MISIFHPFVPFSLRPLIPFDRCRMRKEIKRGEEGRRRRRRRKKNVKRYVEKEKLIWYAREIAGNSTRMPPLYRFANDACEL